MGMVAVAANAAIVKDPKPWGFSNNKHHSGYGGGFKVAPCEENREEVKQTKMNPSEITKHTKKGW